MRKRLSTTDKRSKIIGVKVKPDIYTKLKYLSEMQAQTISTYINEILERNIEIMTKTHKINWIEVSGEKNNEN